MLGQFLAIALAGAIVGIRFRASALIFIAAVAVATNLVSGFIEGGALEYIAISALATLIAVNCGYILGALIRGMFLPHKSNQHADSRVVSG